MFEAGNRWPWLLMIGALALGLYLGHRFGPEGPPAEPVYLPGETIEVPIRDPLSVAREAAQSDTIKRLGLELDQTRTQLRDAQGRLVELQGRLKAGTTKMPPPQYIVKWLEPDCPGFGNYLFSAEVDAFRFSGLNAKGEPSIGWAGEIRCYLHFEDRTETIHKEPFKLGDPRSVVWEVTPPYRGHKHRWYATLHVALVRETRTPELAQYIFDDVPNSITAAFTPDRLRLEVGRRWFPRKRYPIRTGAWADSSSAGVSLGVDW